MFYFLSLKSFLVSFFFSFLLNIFWFTCYELWNASQWGIYQQALYQLIAFVSRIMTKFILSADLLGGVHSCQSAAGGAQCTEWEWNGTGTCSPPGAGCAGLGEIGVSSLTVYTSQQIHSPLFFVKVWVMSSRAGLTIGAPVNARHWGLVEEKEVVCNWLMYGFRTSHSVVHWKSYLKFFTWSSTVVNARALSKALTK